MDEKLKQGFENWQQGPLAKLLGKSAERRERFANTSDLEIERLYLPEERDYSTSQGFPGQYPFTRGIQPTMYRGRLWTMRQYAGFSTAQESNRRYRYLLSQGQTGLSVAFDLPTQMGYDSDHPLSLGEVGKVGVAIDSLKDMEILFDQIPLDKVSTSMTINAPAAVLLCMYMAVAEQQGVPLSAISGTIQNDILKEYVARGTYIFPPQPSMRLICDIFSFATQKLPKFNTISISGYHIREAGATAAQELAFTLANAISYVEAAIKTGLDVDKFAKRLSFFFAVHNDLFEEVAKFRAARRIWADIMKNRFKAEDAKSMMLRFHTQTGGSTLTAQQPMNNVVRVAIQALAAVLGGTQSLHTNSYDEALQLPTEESVAIALKTQQIIAHESGAAETVDPLAGSYYVETLTDQIEDLVRKYLLEIDELGGSVKGIEQGYFGREIGNSAYRFQQDVESGERVIVGVNKFTREDPPYQSQAVSEEGETLQLNRLSELKSEGNLRNQAQVDASLVKLKAAASSETSETENLMPLIFEAVKSYATLGEICGTLREVFGEYRPEFDVF